MDEQSFKDQVIPSQHEGKVIDTEKCIDFETEVEAKDFFKEAKERLLDVNQWGKIAGKMSAAFELHNAQMQKVNRHIEKGDYFKIDIPGPGSEDGDGYDWVQVQAMDTFTETHFEAVAFTVRPVKNPRHPSEVKVSHFFDPVSTSTFTVRRDDKKITAGVYDRNTKPNTDGEGILDKIRNTIIGFLGIEGGAKVQWTSLTKAIVDDTKK
jgi:hypothetical protein